MGIIWGKIVELLVVIEARTVARYVFNTIPDGKNMETRVRLRQLILRNGCLGGLIKTTLENIVVGVI